MLQRHVGNNKPDSTKEKNIKRSAVVVFAVKPSPLCTAQISRRSCIHHLDQTMRNFYVRPCAKKKHGYFMSETQKLGLADGALRLPKYDVHDWFEHA